jgi:hypothetical protein
MDAYAFADAGILYNSNLMTTVQSPLRMDAGIGTCLTISKWGKRNLIQPFTLRFDMPFVLNTAPYSDKGFVQSRWLFGIGRSF